MFYFRTRRRWLEYAPKKCPPLAVVSREDWHAKRPADKDKLKPPVMFVLLNLDTGTRSCTNLKDCCRLIKSLQHDHVHDYGYSDIRYNFLISEDGTIFEGRGWMYTPEQPLFEYNQYEEIALNIAYIGNYTECDPTPEMLQSKRNLLQFGVNNMYLHHRYEVVEVPDNV
ncbi:peptidoglycan recognition protein 1-like [Macrosteles quadrilineatus]|uniref:peptidoglycan recognition protein 1-like n=1 Tax=Macrosteles quadrilineatus TaxID=74068 RepID=UPI0023E0A07E|nr:peptidoglycan recognition protein 1-like [Macrosteles quadrilineatus]